MRDGSCVYRGEAFPEPGEPLDIGGVEVRVLMAPAQIPATWTGLAELVRQVAKEPDEERVHLNLLGTLLAMLENTVEALGALFERPEAAAAAIAGLRAGDDSVAHVRSALAADPTALLYVDFEIIKIASTLVIPAARANREQTGWPYPTVWAGDTRAFRAAARSRPSRPSGR